jgi:hypothetical protein
MGQQEEEEEQLVAVEEQQLRLEDAKVPAKEELDHTQHRMKSIKDGSTHLIQ